MVSLFLAVLVVLPALSVALTPQQEVKPEDLKYLGCYDDAGWNNRTFRKVIYNAKPKIDWSRWKDLSYIVRICANELLKSGKSVFSVQDWGECRTDSNPGRYKGFRLSSNCYSHVGGPLANAVYKIAPNQCNVNDPKYANGRTYYIPHGPAQCDACQCKEGQIHCRSMACQNYASECEKYVPRNNTCCSTCACHHLGKDKTNGEMWDDRRKQGDCRQCQCINGEAICATIICIENCPDPEYIPGKCCPLCKPKAPTTSPWEIITFPTTRPPPTFPPWLVNGFGKRSLRKKRSNKAKVLLRKTFRGY